MRARFARGSFEFLLDAITNVLSREIFIFNYFQIIIYLRVALRTPTPTLFDINLIE